MTEQPVSQVMPKTQCPECGGSLLTDGEVVCQDCHLVVEEQVIDRGPEWRSFADSGGRWNPDRRTGSPETVRMHDKGLSTTMGFDADLFEMETDKRRRLYRQRRLHKQSQANSRAIRNRRYALTQIQRIASAIDLTDPALDDACSLFRDVQRAMLTKGRSIDALVPACVYIATRNADVLRTAEDIAEVSHCSVAKIHDARFTIQRELSVTVPLVTPLDHLPSIFDGLPTTLSEEQRQRIRRIARQASQSAHVNASPSGIAAAAVRHVVGQYGACSQADVAAAAGVTSNTIRARYRGLVDAPDVGVDASS